MASPPRSSFCVAFATSPTSGDYPLPFRYDCSRFFSSNFDYGAAFSSTCRNILWSCYCHVAHSGCFLSIRAVSSPTQSVGSASTRSRRNHFCKYDRSSSVKRFRSGKRLFRTRLKISSIHALTAPPVQRATPAGRETSTFVALSSAVLLYLPKG